MSGENKEEVKACIEESAGEIADVIMGEIVQKLVDNFANMPALGGETA